MAKIFGQLETTRNDGVSIGRSQEHVGFAPYGLQVGDTVPASSSLVSAYNTSPQFTFPHPGFFFVSGSTTCTGTVPPPSMYPGSQLLVTMINFAPMQLSGAAVSGAPSTFAYSGMAATGSLSGSNPTQRGNLLTLDSNGSVGLFSDGLRWIPFVSSGSLRIGL